MQTTAAKISKSSVETTEVETTERHRTAANVLLFATPDEAWFAQGKLEAKAACPSAKKRTVYRVVRMTKAEAKKHSEDGLRWLVCATPWAYRLQQQGRGKVMPMSEG